MAGGIVPPGYTPPGGGMDIMGILKSLFGGAAPASAGVPIPAPIPGSIMAAGQPTAVTPPAMQPPVPQARPPGLTTVPGAQTLPQMAGPSVSPSQAGAWWAPSQGPGDAVLSPDVPQPPPISSVMQPTPGAGGSGAPAAPAPPSHAHMAPGALAALLHGQNPLAMQRAPALVLLSQLLGGGRR